MSCPASPEPVTLRTLTNDPYSLEAPRASAAPFWPLLGRLLLPSHPGGLLGAYRLAGLALHAVQPGYRHWLGRLPGGVVMAGFSRLHPAQSERPLSVALLRTRSSHQRRPPSVSPYRVRFEVSPGMATAWVVMASDASQAMATAAELNPGSRLISCRLLEDW